MPKKLAISAVEKTFLSRGQAVRALSPTSFEVDDGEFVSLVGPSGCGKSTLLYVIAGLEDATSGEVFVDGHAVREPGPDRGMVCQQYNLFPWLTVLENTRFSDELKRSPLRSMSGADIETRIDRTYSLLELMGLQDFYKAYPCELSGGMKQRVAIARALANDPAVLLMDEPFGALDAQTREEMQELLQLIRRHWRKTIVFVTHDVEEAIFLSDRIIVLTPRPGRLRADLRVGLGEVRTVEQKLSPEFLSLKREIVAMLHEGRSASGVRQDILQRIFQPKAAAAP